ncbi:hypothetical protein [Micromonospora sp. RP3T]|uniref:hypothetical protein n=1 Tax=Micromonospora sp. RP3T TaxID=2135446 RepID=UPI000D16390F|nr:hypothetical protein [Micromonospora sp. RP3T]PTA46163.1 hypothetical protein C8054_10465 [Micromonospora sp. RP3T]
MLTPSRLIRVAGVLATLATVATVSACSPAAKRVTAMRQVDGQPTMLIVGCDTFDADRVSVSTEGVSPPMQWDTDRGTGGAVDEVRLLQSPSGWTVDGQTLTAFQPGTEYTASAFDSGHRTVAVRFTLAELAALLPDQVLVGEPGGKRKAVTEDAFRRAAKKSC